MKQTVYILIGVIVLLLGIVVYEIMNYPESKCSSFPCLVYSVDSVKKWDTIKRYDDFVFTAFDSSNQSRWQVVCYGQEETPMDSIYYHPLDSFPFPIYSDSSGVISDSSNLVFGNMVVKADSLRKLVNYPSNTKRSILLVPTTVQYRFKHLKYRIYLAELSADTKKIARFVKLKGTIFDSSSNFVQSDGTNDYIELNPCPPHTMH